MFRIIILDCIYKLKGERSISAIYHLLTGKRSSQTLQDAHIYQLAAYFGIYKELTRNSFNNEMNQLQISEFIAVHEDGMAYITEIGFQLYNEQRNKFLIDTFQGLRYERITNDFRLRLQLWIQTLTNIASNNKHFVTITDNKQAQFWVKRMYSQQKHAIHQWMNDMYQELFQFLSTINVLDASIFVDRLTGYTKIGLSKEQIAHKYNLSYHDVELHLVHIHHQLISYLLTNKNSLLFRIIEDLVEQVFITDSARQTYRLWMKGHTISEIARIRRLKESTIQDHLIEIAYIDPTFNIETFISSEGIIKITNVCKDIGSKRLKKIKLALDEQYSYFQIRLVLAKNQLS